MSVVHRLDPELVDRRTSVSDPGEDELRIGIRVRGTKEGKYDIWTSLRRVFIEGRFCGRDRGKKVLGLRVLNRCEEKGVGEEVKGGVVGRRSERP